MSSKQKSQQTDKFHLEKIEKSIIQYCKKTRGRKPPCYINRVDLTETIIKTESSLCSDIIILP